MATFSGVGLSPSALPVQSNNFTNIADQTLEIPQADQKQDQQDLFSKFKDYLLGNSYGFGRSGSSNIPDTAADLEASVVGEEQNHLMQTKRSNKTSSKGSSDGKLASLINSVSGLFGNSPFEQTLAMA